MRIVLILLFSFCFCNTQAQEIDRQVIAAAGETLSNSDIMLDFTVGELAVSTLDGATLTLNQGFHQNVISLTLSAEVIMFLEGAAFDAATGEEDLMRDTLRAVGVIPTTSPYTEDEATTTTAVFDVTGDDAIVDWVLVQLRDGTDSSIVLESKSGLLQRDGDVVGVDGVTPLEFSEVTAGDYFVSVNHRNHLGIVSANPITLGTETGNVVDFTQTELFVEGGIIAVTLLTNGNYALVGGDEDQNGQIVLFDLNNVRSQLGLSGYNNADIDLNSQIVLTDINLFVNQNIGRGSQID